MTWQEVERELQHWAYPGQEYRRYEKGLLRKDGQPGFNTRTGRIELYSPMAEEIGEKVALPYYDEPNLQPVYHP